MSMARQNPDRFMQALNSLFKEAKRPDESRRQSKRVPPLCAQDPGFGTLPGRRLKKLVNN